MFSYQEYENNRGTSINEHGQLNFPGWHSGHPPEISLMAQALEVPDLISLAVGFVDQVRYRIDWWLRRWRSCWNPRKPDRRSAVRNDAGDSITHPAGGETYQSRFSSPAGIRRSIFCWVPDRSRFCICSETCLIGRYVLVEVPTALSC